MHVHTPSLNLPLNASLQNLTFTIITLANNVMLIGMARGIPGGVIGKKNFSEEASKKKFSYDMTSERSSNSVSALGAVSYSLPTTWA